MDREAHTRYERLIRQEEYSGEACAAEHVIACFLAGVLSAEERSRLEQHFSECEGCRDELASLRAAASHFDARKEALWAGALARAEKLGIPASAASLEQQQTLAGLIVLGLADLRPDAAPDRRNEVRAMLLALQTAARMQATKRARGASPGHRSAAGDALQAPVLDSLGRPVLDQLGQPTSVDFHVVRATLEGDGRCVIDLSTAQAGYWETPQQRFVVCVALEFEDRRLMLPPEKIYPNGRATVVAHLLPGMPIGALPQAAIRASVSAL